MLHGKGDAVITVLISETVVTMRTRCEYFFELILVEVATFSCASISNKYSLPMRRAGSPVHFSSQPSIAKSTPDFLRIRTSAFCTFLARSSVEPAHPTQRDIQPRGRLGLP